MLSRIDIHGAPSLFCLRNLLTSSRLSVNIKLTSEVNLKRLSMQIEYKNAKIEKVCTNTYEAEKKHGREMAAKIRMRIRQIGASVSVEEMVSQGIGRCHPLKGQRKEQYAVDLVHPYRLVFEKRGDEVQIACIMEVVDYH